jgi:hypothetical protein
MYSNKEPISRGIVNNKLAVAHNLRYQNLYFITDINPLSYFSTTSRSKVFIII